MRNGFLTQIETVVGNYGYNLSFTLQDSAGVAVDISNATLVFKAQLESDSAVQVSGSMVVDGGPTGVCHYQVQQGDFPIAGVWNAQIVATYLGEVLTFTGIVITVDEQLPV